MNEKYIKELARRREFDRALEECERWLTEPGADELEVLRTRAYVQVKKGDVKRALDDHRQIASDPLATFADLYMGAYDALSVEAYEQARDWLSELMKRAALAENHSYDAVAHFQIAYAEMQLGRYEAALSSLEKAIKIDPNIALPIPGESGIASGNDLKAEIERRRTAS